MKINPNRLLIIFVGLGIFGWVGANPAGAAVINERTFRLNEDTVRRGYTVADVRGNLKLGIIGGAFQSAQVVRIAQIDNTDVPIPPDKRVIAGPYQVVVPGMISGDTVKPLTLRIKYDSASGSKTVLVYYNLENNKWQPLKAKFVNGYATASVTKLNGVFAIWTTAVKAPVITTPAPKVQSVAALVMNNLTGQVLYQKNADQERPMASLTKMMTALVFLDHNPGFNKVIAMDKSDNAIGAKLYINAGETLTVKDIFYTMLVGSANNCAKALARSTGLSREQFVAEMNKKAKEFGLTHTKFTDPSGLDTGNVTTAQDYMKLTDQALKQAEVRKATTTKAYVFKTISTKRTHTIKNTNLLTNSALTLISGKTGYLDEAGFCLMTRAKNKTGTEVTAVVLGSVSRTQSTKEVEKLLRWGLGG
ncbi:MAG: serine hydrolase [Patescibacteria group bacterium]|jgi:D-alanyl-D-alanine endopeptidase (penicillin-binding protein 7)